MSVSFVENFPTVSARGVGNRGDCCVGRSRASSFAQQLKAGIIQSNTPVIRGGLV